MIGWMINGWRLGGQIAEQQSELSAKATALSERARAIERLSAESSDLSGQLHESRRAASEARAKVITKEVIRYVQSDYAGRCELPAGWVRLDTAAASGVPADAAATGVPDDAPSGFTDADALAVITDRSMICRAEIDKLEALQEYVRGQLRVINGAG